MELRTRALHDLFGAEIVGADLDADVPALTAAIDGAIGVLFALSDGGIDSRTRPVVTIRGGLPGPGGGFGLAWPG